MTVGMGEEFICFLAGGIETDWMVDVAVKGEGKCGTAAIDRAARGIDQMLYLVMRTALKVCADVGLWVLQRVTHPGLCRQIYHALRALLAKDRGNSGSIFEVYFEVSKIIVTTQTSQPRLL